jgi:hypothetical protein
LPHFQSRQYPMPQALDPTAYVHEGFWTDWTKGTTRGLTLTLCPTSANLLIATLALFVTMSGGQLWTIVRFALHQARASDRYGTLGVPHNQQQVILRNATTDIATARLFIRLAWSWRKTAVKLFSSSIVIVLLAISHAVFFMVAGAFSAALTNAGPSVLSRSPYCGDFNESYLATVDNGVNASTTGTFQLFLEFIAKEEHDVQLSLEYARECYNASSLSSSCDTFQQPRLYWETLQNGSCPFDSTACSDSGTTVFDTGLIDSHNDLGINAHVDDRLFYRKVTNCTVLNDTAQVTDWVNGTNSAGAPPVDIAYAYFGHSIQYPTEWTYAYSDFAAFYTNFSGQTTTPYQVFPQIAFGQSTTSNKSSFAPIHEIQQSDADITLLFLSFTGRYAEPVDDPWFSAHRLHLADSRTAIARTTYARDRPVSTLGCTEQHQVCTNAGECTPLLGFNQVQAFMDAKFNFTANQNVTLNRIMNAVQRSTMREVVAGLAVGSTPLLAINATASASTTLSLGLPPNQWQLEAEYWHSVAMSQLQRKFVEYGTGQMAAQTAYIVPPTTASERWICDNLMIRGTAYQSFSVLAIALIVGFGSLVIVVSLNIESMASCIQTRLGKGLAARKSWDDHDMLGLKFWEKRKFEQQLPSKNGSSCCRSPQQTHVQKYGERPRPRPTVEPTPTPDPGRILHAVSIASYQEGFIAGSKGSWI